MTVARRPSPLVRKRMRHLGKSLRSGPLARARASQPEHSVDVGGCLGREEALPAVRAFVHRYFAYELRAAFELIDLVDLAGLQA